MGMYRYILVLALAAALIAASIPSLHPGTATAAYAAAGDRIRIYFLPMDGEEALHDIVQLIDNSASYVYVAIYDMEDMDIARALLRAHSRGVDVRIVSDMDTFDEKSAINYLRRNGIPVVLDNRYSDYMHNKFMVIDNETVVTGTANFNERSFLRYTNNVVIIRSRLVALDYYYEFMEMYRGLFGGGNRTPYENISVGDAVINVYFAPDDDVAGHIIPLIDSARHTIFFAAFTFTHWGLAEALARAAERGVRVLGVMESWNAEKGEAARIYSYLSSHGAEMRMDANEYIMHLKTFIIDNETVVTGSWNPTYHAQLSNDENLVVIRSREIGEAYARWFLARVYPRPMIIVEAVDPGGRPVPGASVTAEELSSHTTVHAVTNASGIAVIEPREEWSIGSSIRITVSTGSFLGEASMTTITLKPYPQRIRIVVEDTGLLNEKTGAIIVAAAALLAPLIYGRIRKHLAPRRAPRPPQQRRRAEASHPTRVFPGYPWNDS